MKLHEIGPRIKEIRKDKGLTQEHLSKLSGISRVTLGKLENGGVVSISIKTLDIMLKTLGYEMEFKSTQGFGLPTLDELGYYSGDN
ncbi:MAG: helix-turn-helix transcriptional regulator [Candidatus Marinimicrobia bacterium]|nr:helix-turn-helix transcriptional regulator [Candidatus Neomarinimicrobiota bacterium]